MTRKPWEAPELVRLSPEQVAARAGRPLCADCGVPLMLDHAVCFSDECVRARWEASEEKRRDG